MAMGRETLALFLGGVLTVTLVGTSALGATLPDDQATGSTLQAAMSRLAADQGVSVDELDAIMNWQNDFAMMVTSIGQKYPNDYAYASVTTSGATIGFREGVPDGAATTLAGFRIPVAVEEHVGFSDDQIGSIAEALHYRVRNALGDEVATSANAREGSVTVFVAPSLEEAAVAIVAESRQQAPMLRVVVEADGSFTMGEDGLIGGDPMSNACTSGFSVRTTTYPHGMMTAAHCNNSASQGGFSLTFRGESSVRDVQWHSTASTTTDPRFRVGSTTYRTVTGTANPVQGQSLCKYGTASGYTCDTTYLDNQCRGAYCDMMTMNNRYAAPGDSGGPWFSGNTAYGIHSGWVTIWLNPRDMFTPIYSANSALGTTVKY